jgi:hypothetical protein
MGNRLVNGAAQLSCIPNYLASWQALSMTLPPPPYRDALSAILAVRREIALGIFGPEIDHVPGKNWVDAVDTILSEIARQECSPNIPTLEDVIAVEARLIDQWEDIHGLEVPYHPSFEESFPLRVALCRLAFIEKELPKWCESWSLTPTDDYQYLLDLLADAELPDTLPDSVFVQHYRIEPAEYPDGPRRAQRLERAIEWFRQGIEKAAPSTRMLVFPSPPVPEPIARRQPEPAQLHHLTVQQLATVLVECGVSPESRAGKWAAVVSALRRLDMLIGSHVAVQKWLTAEFGAPATIRRTLSDKGEHNTVFSDREEKRVLEKAKELLKQYQL